MTTQKQQQQSQLKQLIALGKEQGYLTYAEVNDHLPESITDTDQVEDIIQMINDMGITVVEKAADADQLMIDESADSTDEVAAEEERRHLRVWAEESAVLSSSSLRRAPKCPTWPGSQLILLGCEVRGQGTQTSQA